MGKSVGPAPGPGARLYAPTGYTPSSPTPANTDRTTYSGGPAANGSDGDTVSIDSGAAAPAPSSAQIQDRVVQAAKAFIDAAAGHPDALPQAQGMLSLIPPIDAEFEQYAARVHAIAISGATAAAPAPSIPASGSGDGLGTTNGAPTRPGGLVLPAPPAGSSAAGAATEQDAFAAAQGAFAQASDQYDRAIADASNLAQAAKAITDHQQQALAAYQAALSASAALGSSVRPALDAMVARLKDMGATAAQISGGSGAPVGGSSTAGSGTGASGAAAPSGSGTPASGATTPAAGGPATASVTPLPVGPLPGVDQNPQPSTPRPDNGSPNPAVANSTAPPAAAPASPSQQFFEEEAMLRQAIYDFTGANTSDELDAETKARTVAAAREACLSAYTSAVNAVGQMDSQSQAIYKKELRGFEANLQFYQIASTDQMASIRTNAKVDKSAMPTPTRGTTAPGAGAGSSGSSAAAPSGQAPEQAATAPTDNDAPANDEENQIRTQLAGSLPKMNASQVVSLSTKVFKAASSDQRAFMIKTLLDHYFPNADVKKTAADVVEVAQTSGHLELTLRALDRLMRADGVKWLLGKLDSADRQRVVVDTFAPGAVSPDYLTAMSSKLNKDDVNSLLDIYGADPESSWFKQLSPDTRAQLAKILNVKSLELARRGK